MRTGERERQFLGDELNCDDTLGDHDGSTARVPHAPFTVGCVHSHVVEGRGCDCRRDGCCVGCVSGRADLP